MLLCVTLYLGGIIFILFILLNINCDPPLYFYKYFRKSPEVLKGKVAWITGAGSGIGKQLALSLAKVGTKLVLHSLQGEDLESVRALCLEAAQGRLSEEDFLIIYGDVAGFGIQEIWVEKVLRHFKKVDILINNAGLSAFQTVFESSSNMVRRLFDANFFGSIWLTKALLPHFRQRKTGHIVVLSSVLAFFSTPNSSAYCASKQAIRGFYDSLRVEEAKHGIKVTILFPGGVKTNIIRNFLKKDGVTINMVRKNLFSQDMLVCAALCLSGIALILFLLLKIDCDPLLYFCKYFGKSPDESANLSFHNHLEALRGKVVWITGAGSGIGRQLAFALAKVGAKLVLHSLQGEDLDSVRTVCLENAQGRLSDEDILLIHGDVAHFDMHEKWVEQVLLHFGKVRHY
ncbi:unnamed protein product [Darwinula stevensoni]|uniref:Dehydrogenase/reductase SDR family member 7 n=1 Tax=Darwinula stevensoni TaxID=69355 RepID=A0A7R9FNL5_9CRUS|nr:unnamed protein product [Darwinula stevensoni]CAG0896525.1 unnamed protein product [Darwinula stevensoni]